MNAFQKKHEAAIKSLIAKLQSQIELAREGKGVFFGSAEDAIAVWEKKIAKHEKNLAKIRNHKG